MSPKNCKCGSRAKRLGHGKDCPTWQQQKSFAVEVTTSGDGGTFAGNALRFATKAEAEGYALDLSCRWTAVREYRIVESTDPVNYAIVDGRLIRLESGSDVTPAARVTL